MLDSLSLVTSNDEDKAKLFGSGFIIHQHEKETYVLTCYHVIEELGKNVLVDSRKGEIVSYDDEIDLAIVKVNKKLKGVPLRLNVMANKEMYFHSKGWIRYLSEKNKIASFEGQLGTETQIVRDSEKRVKAWNLILEEELDKSKLERGCSGAPVINKMTDEVLGIITSMKGGNRGDAIAIDELRSTWKKDIPEELRSCLLFAEDHYDQKETAQIGDIATRREEIDETMHIRRADYEDYEKPLDSCITFAKDFGSRTRLSKMNSLVSRCKDLVDIYKADHEVFKDLTKEDKLAFHKEYFKLIDDILELLDLITEEKLPEKVWNHG